MESISKMVDEIAARYFSEDTTDRNAWPSLSIVPRNYLAFEPQVIFDLAMALLSSTVSVAFYRILKLWITARNGRKVRVRLPNGFEVEATQLSHEQFNELFAKIYSTYVVESVPKLKKSEKALMKYIAEKKLTVMSKQDVLEEELMLREIRRKKSDQLSKR